MAFLVLKQICKNRVHSKFTYNKEYKIKELVKEEATMIKEISEVKAKVIQDSTDLIRLRVKYDDRVDQLESANKELTELRKVKYQFEEFKSKYNELVEERNIKTNKFNTKTDKTK